MTLIIWQKSEVTAVLSPASGLFKRWANLLLPSGCVCPLLSLGLVFLDSGPPRMGSEVV